MPAYVFTIGPYGVCVLGYSLTFFCEAMRYV